MPGSVHDGHAFVEGALAAGAAGVLVSKPVDGPHVLVGDTAGALEALGRAARARCSATVIGVTGSVGKTSTKEALAAALDRCRPGEVHRSVKSYNNHTGVPLSLARMPRTSRFAVLEMGMNNAGEIAALTRLVRPDVALVTAIAPAHVENLGSEEAIADAKAEIFEGLEPDGVAIVPNDSEHRGRLVKAARRFAGRIVTFGSGDADIHAVHAVRAEQGGSLITAALAGPGGDLHHLPARRALDFERAGGACGDRGGRRRRRARRAGAGRPRAGSRAAASATGSRSAAARRW